MDANRFGFAAGHLDRRLVGRGIKFDAFCPAYLVSGVVFDTPAANPTSKNVLKLAIAGPANSGTRAVTPEQVTTIVSSVGDL